MSSTGSLSRSPRRAGQHEQVPTTGRPRRDSEQGPHAEALFLTSLADGEFELVHPDKSDLRRMAQLVSTYHDLPLGAVDASVVALAERMGDYDVATLDRRHFTVIRPAGGTHLTLYP